MNREELEAVIAKELITHTLQIDSLIRPRVFVFESLAEGKSVVVGEE